MTDRTAEDPGAAAAALAETTGFAAHDVAVVLGSGWRPAADLIGTSSHEIAMADLPGFVRPVVAGPGGTVRSVPVGDHRVLVLLGRTHLYEGHGVAAVARAVHSPCCPPPRPVSSGGSRRCRRRPGRRRRTW